jgi:glucosamine--fructose-6-phosphate aminotransferase (isomerizing)
VQLAAAWTNTPALADAVARCPDLLDAATALDWAPALLPLATATSLYVLGRGLGLGGAQELALKLKETCRLHAEAFSTAEVAHGPLALVEPGFPIIALGHAGDPAATATRETIARLVGLGARVVSTLEVAGATALPIVSDVPPILGPLVELQTAYLALPALARARGLDADLPCHLTKITQTR